MFVWVGEASFKQISLWSYVNFANNLQDVVEVSAQTFFSGCHMLSSFIDAPFLLGKKMHSFGGYIDPSTTVCLKQLTIPPKKH